MNDLRGKVAVITGAASGIGRALALQLGQEGCAQAIVDLNEKGLAETCGLLGKCPQQVASYIQVCPARVYRSSKTGSAPDPGWGFLRVPRWSQNQYRPELLRICPEILGSSSRSRQGI